MRYHSTMHLKRRFNALLLAMFMMVQPLHAGDLPELGDISNTELSVATEKKVGQQIMNEIRWRDPAYLDDADVESYLNQIGGRLVAACEDPSFGFQFFPINDASINAFAMPGGFIGVHTGLILAAQSESELAGVLAHEISHVTQRHIARQVFQSRHMGMATMLAMGLALLAARSNAQVAGAAIATSEAGAISAQLAYSRDFERESDRLGFETLQKAGFDVHGMGVFFERLQKAVRLYENNATVYLRSHPLTGERLSDMQNREQGSPYRQVPDSPDFQLVRAKLRAKQGIPSEAIKDFERLIGEQKYASEAAARFGYAVALMRAKQWAAAERELLRVKDLKVLSPLLTHQLADVRFQRNDLEGAKTYFKEGMNRFPSFMALVYGYAETLIQGRRFKEALTFVDQQLRIYPQDVKFYRLKAEAHAGQGQMALQHLALADSLIIQGQTQAAMEQLNQAQAAGDANFYELSAIEARQRELRRRLLEEKKERRN